MNLYGIVNKGKMRPIKTYHIGSWVVSGSHTFTDREAAMKQLCPGEEIVKYKVKIVERFGKNGK